MKAYIAHDGDEQWTVTYATNGAAARRQAAGEFGCDFAEVESCRRAPSLDQYADTDIPIREMLDLGWWFECDGCGGRMLSDDEDYDASEAIGTYNGRCFCSPACRDEKLESDLLEHDARLLAIGELKLHLQARYSETVITSVHAYANGDGHVQQAFVEFVFPGSVHGGGKLDRHAGLTVAAGDYDAWRRYREEAAWRRYREEAWAYPDLPRVVRMFER